MKTEVYAQGQPIKLLRLRTTCIYILYINYQLSSIRLCVCNERIFNFSSTRPACQSLKRSWKLAVAWDC